MANRKTKKKHCENLRQFLLLFKKIVRNSEISFVYDIPDDIRLRCFLGDVIVDVNMTIFCLDPSRITRVRFEAIIVVKRPYVGPMTRRSGIEHGLFRGPTCECVLGPIFRRVRTTLFPIGRKEISRG